MPSRHEESLDQILREASDRLYDSLGIPEDLVPRYRNSAQNITESRQRNRRVYSPEAIANMVNSLPPELQDSVSESLREDLNRQIDEEILRGLTIDTGRVREEVQPIPIADRFIHRSCFVPNSSISIEIAQPNIDAIRKELKTCSIIRTSYFAKYKEANGISISRFKPKWFKGDSYLPLAPSKNLLLWWKSAPHNEENKELYHRYYYQETLSKLDPYKVAKYLEGKVLLCYEKSDDFCHRHIVAEWLNSYGVECEEIL